MTFKHTEKLRWLFIGTIAVFFGAAAWGNEKEVRPSLTSDQYVALFNTVDSFVQQFTRPFTMLTLGADEDSCALALLLAQDHPTSACIIADTINTQKESPLLEHCQLLDIHRNVTLLQTTTRQDELTHMAECEHIDVTLLPSPTYWFNSAWQSTLETLSRLSSHVILVIPLDKTYAMVRQYLETQKALVLRVLYNADNITPLLALYHMRIRTNPTLRRKTWLKKKIP